MHLHDDSITAVLFTRPAARAYVSGDAKHPALHGYADFYPCRNGTLLLAEFWGLPFETAACAQNIFAMHIHAGRDCSGAKDMAFAGAGGHFNPDNCPHPAHAGDLPPLFGNRGHAWSAFYTERFAPETVTGRTLLVHGRRDDFTSQPAGDAGERIGCGVIKALR